MKTFELLTIVAIVLGPILAVQIERIISKIKEAKNRRITIYKSLMATRASQLSYEHVRALNSIDVEFYGKKFHKTRTCWKEYLDHLEDKTYGIERMNEWETKRNELLIKLINTMGRDVGYNFDNVDIKRRIYAPQGHQQLEYENIEFRKKLIDY